MSRLYSPLRFDYLNASQFRCFSKIISNNSNVNTSIENNEDIFLKSQIEVNLPKTSSKLNI